MKICVTGGAGFIGSHLTDRLIEQGHQVVVIDNLSTGLGENVNPKAEFIKADLSARNYKFEKAFNELKDCDQIYHLAATVGYKKVLEDPLKCFNNNVNSLKAVIEACELTKTKVLFASSSEVYGIDRENSLFEDDIEATFTNPQNGKDCYSISKWVGEFLLSWNTNVNSVIVRLFNTSGARQRPDFGMVVPTFVKASLDGSEVTVADGGYQKRCFCHVDETVFMIMKVMNAETKNADVFNIGNPVNCTSIRDLCKDVGCNWFNYNSYDELYGHDNFVDSCKRLPNIAKFVNRFAWRPIISLDSIIEDNRNWQKEFYGNVKLNS